MKQKVKGSSCFQRQRAVCCMCCKGVAETRVMRGTALCVSAVRNPRRKTESCRQKEEEEQARVCRVMRMREQVCRRAVRGADRSVPAATAPAPPGVGDAALRATRAQRREALRAVFDEACGIDCLGKR